MIPQDRRYQNDPYLVAIAKRLPFGAVQRAEVTFTTAGVDVEVTHSLPTTNPEDIEVLAYNWELTSAPAEAPVVYRYTGTGARPWTLNRIAVRATVPGSCTLLLTLPTRS